MQSESRTPDVAEIRSGIEAGSYDEFAAFVERHYAADAVMDSSNVGLGPFEGLAAILVFLKDYWSMWEEHHHYAEAIVDLGQGVQYTVIREDGRLNGSDSEVQATNGWVTVWDNGKVARVTVYTDIDEARAAAEKLAEERGGA